MTHLASMSRFTHLVSLSISLTEGKFAEQFSTLNEMCASVSSPALEQLEFTLIKWTDQIPVIFEALTNLRTIDNTLATSRFSRLSTVTFEYCLEISLHKEPKTYGCLIGTPSDSAAAGVSTSPDFSRDDDISLHAYTTDENCTRRLSLSWLKDFLRQRAEGETPRLRDRGMVTHTMEINYHCAGRRNIAEDEYDH